MCNYKIENLKWENLIDQLEIDLKANRPYFWDVLYKQGEEFEENQLSIYTQGCE